jgi:hypothetical protein
VSTRKPTDFGFFNLEFVLSTNYLCCALNVFIDLQFFDYPNIESNKKSVAMCRACLITDFLYVSGGGGLIGCRCLH